MANEDRFYMSEITEADTPIYRLGFEYVVYERLDGRLSRLVCVCDYAEDAARVAAALQALEAEHVA